MVIYSESEEGDAERRKTAILIRLTQTSTWFAHCAGMLDLISRVTHSQKAEQAKEQIAPQKALNEEVPTSFCACISLNRYCRV